jgi:creatinine amidohydrolase/Fe(II)-dependent formamide hydrolase-like protein
VNGHGGNTLLEKHLFELEKMLDVRIHFNSKLIKLEGAHAGTKESSMGAAAGLIEEIDPVKHGDFKAHPEVGFVGLLEAHQNKRIKELAEKTRREGVKIDVELGMKLLDQAVTDIVKSIKEFESIQL